MAVIDDKIFNLVTPKSESDANYADFEYMLAWYGRDGAYINYLFTDWEQSVNANTQIMNISDVEKIESLIGSEENEVTLTAEDLSLNDLKVLLSIYSAKKIIRVFKDNTTERVAIDKNSKNFRQTNGRYNLDIDIVEYQKPLPR